MKQKHVIDTHKSLTSIFILGLMAYYDAWDVTVAWIYLALHGTYGILWVLKSQIFPDKSWETRTGVGFALVLWFTLCLYWIAPWIIVTQRPPLPGWYLCLCVSCYAFGLFFHFVSDMQKHVSLSLRPGELLTDGLWAKVRNPNYFGELLLYLGFIGLAAHWLPLLCLGVIVATVFVPNMIKKDRSLSRYPAFVEYRKRSKLFIPFVV